MGLEGVRIDVEGEGENGQDEEESIQEDERVKL